MRTKLRVKLEIQAPVLSQKPGVLAFGTDAGIIDRNGKQCLPGTLIKGAIRHVFNDFIHILGDEDTTLRTHSTQWFGKTSEEGSFLPQRATLTFGHHWVASKTIGDNASDHRRNRIAIGENGAVQTGSLLIIDTPYPTGELIEFVGHVVLKHKDEEELDLCIKWLNKALDFLPAIGAYKSIGFGNIRNTEIQKVGFETTSAESIPIEPNTTRIGFMYLPQSPFCIAKPHLPNSNRFEALEDISGNSLKALFAERIREQYPESASDHLNRIGFDDWVFTQAKPVKRESQVSAKPYVRQCSIFKGQGIDVKLDSNWFDAAGVKYNELPFVKTANGEETLLFPTFSVDWKYADDQAINTLIGASPDAPNKLLQLHTAIHAETGQSEDEGLYSMELIDPEGFVWLGDIDLSLLSQQELELAIEQIEQIIQAPLWGLGKTSAAVECAALALPTSRLDTLSECNKNTHDNSETRTVSLVLQTEAQLFINANSIAPTAGSIQLAKLYDEYWQNVSGKKLTLSSYFADQALRGGAYLYHRFIGNDNHGEYTPYWMTQPGSVFTLKYSSHDHNDVAQLINHWLKVGLPLPNTTSDDPKNRHWRRSPYINRNGFGEVALLREFKGVQPVEGVEI
ncbi:RAMP superfamily CRISPR-associated protein [Vibrio sp. FJH11]